MSPGQAASLTFINNIILFLEQKTEVALGTLSLLSKHCNKITFQDFFSLHIYVY